MGRWRDVVLGQMITLAPLRRRTEGWRGIRMDVESKVYSCSSLLEIISFRCTVPHYAHTHTHTDSNTHVDTNRLLVQLKIP